MKAHSLGTQLCSALLMQEEIGCKRPSPVCALVQWVGKEYCWVADTVALAFPEGQFPTPHQPVELEQLLENTHCISSKNASNRSTTRGSDYLCLQKLWVGAAPLLIIVVNATNELEMSSFKRSQSPVCLEKSPKNNKFCMVLSSQWCQFKSQIWKRELKNDSFEVSWQLP